MLVKTALNILATSRVLNVLNTSRVLMTPEPKKRIPRPLRDCIYFLLEVSGDDASQELSRVLQDKYNIATRHYAILNVLIEEGEMNQQDLAIRVNVNRNAMVQLIDQLEQLGLAKRTVNQKNRREHIIAVTDQGKRVGTQARSAVSEANENYIMKLNNAERKQLITLLNKLIEQ